MFRRALVPVCCLLALALLSTCGTDADPTNAPTTEQSTNDGTGDRPPVVPPSLPATADADGLLDQLTGQFGKVKDRATAVQERQAIEVSLRFLRKQLPTPDDKQPRPSVFDGVLAGRQEAVKKLLAAGDAAIALPECKPVLESYVQALHTLLQ